MLQHSKEKLRLLAAKTIITLGLRL